MAPLMIDILGQSLSSEDKEILDHPLVGGVILFTRNYDEPQQLRDLTAQIRAATRRPLLISVDHEGGRVQRFRSGFTRLPAMSEIYHSCNGNLQQGADYARRIGWLMASELLAFEIDFSFAPVLDIDGISEVIGDRAFHTDPDVVVLLASAFIRGMHQAGMKATGKHFPGHGSVKPDSHIALPIDERASQDIFNLDMRTFVALNRMGLMDAVMPAHVIYPKVDSLPAGFSKVWIQKILRQQMNFNGVVFSDDLSMQATAVIGDMSARVTAALGAGCDMALLCNDRPSVVQVLDSLGDNVDGNARLNRMIGTANSDLQALQKHPEWQQTAADIARDFHG